MYSFGAGSPAFVTFHLNRVPGGGTFDLSFGPITGVPDTVVSNCGE